MTPADIASCFWWGAARQSWRGDKRARFAGNSVSKVDALKGIHPALSLGPQPTLRTYGQFPCESKATLDNSATSDQGVRANLDTPVLGFTVVMAVVKIPPGFEALASGGYGGVNALHTWGTSLYARYVPGLGDAIIPVPTASGWQLISAVMTPLRRALYVNGVLANESAYDCSAFNYPVSWVSFGPGNDVSPGMLGCEWSEAVALAGDVPADRVAAETYIRGNMP